MRIKNFLIISSSIILFSLAGCSDSYQNNLRPTMPYSSEYLEILDWNDYTFTENIPQPSEGEISSVCVIHSEEGKKYNIIIENINREKSDEYIFKLKSDGYKIVESSSNNVSAGIVMRKDKNYLSISYSDGILGMLIEKDYNVSNGNY